MIQSKSKSTYKMRKSKAVKSLISIGSLVIAISVTSQVQADQVQDAPEPVLQEFHQESDSQEMSGEATRIAEEMVASDQPESDMTTSDEELTPLFEGETSDARANQELLAQPSQTDVQALVDDAALDQTDRETGDPKPGASGDGYRYDADGQIIAVENGWHLTTSDGYAPAQHAFITDQDITGISPLAEVDPSKTLADLEAVENTSPLNPANYLAKDTFAYQPLTGNEPISPMSSVMHDTAIENNLTKNHWLLGSNIGMGYEGKENIPVLSVDSSNPYQHYVMIEATDSRAVAAANNKTLMLGKIPIPQWYLANPGQSGDHSLAIYDKATGIWRSMFYLAPITSKDPVTGEEVQSYTEDGLARYTFASGGYLLAKPNFEGFGDQNYWMSLMAGTSSVVGLTNELTQIGVDELKAGEIKHAISLTWEDYQAISSFPAKMADGQINMILAEGDQRLSQGESSERYRVAAFQSGRIDVDLANSYIKTLTSLHQKGLISLAQDYTVTQGEISADTDLDQFAQDHDLDQATKVEVATFIAYLKGNDLLTVSASPYPYAPHAGQRFTISPEIDLDRVIANAKLDPVTGMILKAIQTYGGIITDRNNVINALNFESPYSYAAYARQGKNVYLEDPEMVALFKDFNSHNFPLDLLQFIDYDYAEKTGDEDIKDTSKPYQLVDTSQSDGRQTIYIPDQLIDQTYQGKSVFNSINQYLMMPDPVTLHKVDYQMETDMTYGQVGPTLEQTLMLNTSDQAALGTHQVATKINTSGYTQKNADGRYDYIDASAYRLYKPSLGYRDLDQINQSQELKQAYRTSWQVTILDPSQPIARTDLVRVSPDEVKLVDVLANDEAYYGAKAGLRAEEMAKTDWAELYLLDQEGRKVKSLVTDYGTLTVTQDQRLQLDTSGLSISQGIAPLIRYTYDLTNGQGSLETAGAIQIQLFGQRAGSNRPLVAETEG